MLDISLRAQEVFRIGTFPVTNAVLLASVVVVLMAVIALTLYRKMSLVPRGIQNVTELILEGTLGLMDDVLGSREKSEKYLPLVLTIFLFILFSNWLGLVPGIGSLVLNNNGTSTPLLRSPASDLNFTLAIALIAVTLVNALSVAATGLKSRLSIFFDFRSPIDFFIGILELISEFAKIVSFSFRLFGNIFAGEVLLAIMAFLVPYLMPLPFMFMEIFVGFIQAFIFGMLTLVFVAIGTGDEEKVVSLKNGERSEINQQEI
ncbi:MAG: F0F1 ATP synthase subunit A [Patescibacteria group bacterium]|nr:F0F1 ATP synthase subunit A [Patescibacteria group bacterium]MCL5224080.1 F0F1 ATP synthase subunit A [Patescibacteria group bacterium]